MATLKELYDLVHALDKSEKKHLSLMIKAIGGKASDRYAYCFKSINKQTRFDGEKLKQKLATGVSGMNISEANNNFYGFLCKALLNYKKPATANLGLLKDLILVETLISKGQLIPAQKLHTPLLKRLKQGNSFGLLARGLELNSILTASIKESAYDYKRRLEIMDERRQSAQDQLKYVEVIRLSTLLSRASHDIGPPRTKEQWKVYAKIYDDPVCHLPITGISKQLFIMYAPIKTEIMALVAGDEAAIKECKVALKELYKNFHLSEHATAAFYLLDNLVSDVIRLQDSKTLTEGLEELRQLLPYAKQKGLYQLIQSKIMMVELSMCFIKRDYEKGIVRVKEWTKPQILDTWKEAPLAYINYLWCARICYLSNLPEKALDYLQPLQLIEKTLRPVIFINYKFLTLLCHYKMRNYTLVNYGGQALYKHLLRMEKLYEPERALLRFFKNSGSFDKTNKQLQVLRTAFNKLQKDPLNEPFFQFADYDEWLKGEVT
ncbi:MAG: hypothetical protein U0V74_14930 [Chitinophagales bacterium]